MKTQLEKNIKNIRVGLNWTSGREYSFDLDLSAFLLDEKDLARSDEDLVFYNNHASVNDALLFSGDDRSGMVDGTNESIFVDLEKIPENIHKAVFCVTFDDTEEEYISINTDVDELISMLTSVIKTSKNRIKTNINLELS